MTGWFRNAAEAMCPNLDAGVDLALASSTAHAQEVEELTITAHKKTDNSQDAQTVALLNGA